MADRFLKHVPTGQVFIWQARFATEDGFVECADATGAPLPIAEPEKVVTEDVVAAKRGGRKAKVEEIVGVLNADEALSVDATRGLAAKGV